MTNRHKVILLLITVVSAFALMIGISIIRNYDKRVLSEFTTASVNVDVDVYNCQLQFTVYPEKRIPTTNNWSTDLDMEIFGGSTSLGNFTATTNNAGVATINLCDEGIYLSTGTYSYVVKATSYLGKRFDNYPGFSSNLTVVDFSSAGELKVGDTGNSDDNKVNVLDLTEQVQNLYTNTPKSDLNKDGEVNSLDVSALLANFYATGEN